MIHGKRGRESNRKIEDKLKQSAMKIMRAQYEDFNPTFTHEKLVEDDGFSVSVETLRQWMIDDDLWQPKRKKAKKHHPIRERRACFGEMVQIDGSPHDWFEGSLKNQLAFLGDTF